MSQATSIIRAMFNDQTVIRTYGFRKGTSGRCLVCNVFLPELEDRLPAVSLTIEIGEYKPSQVLKNRVHIWSDSKIPIIFVIDETERFFRTYKQMYYNEVSQAQPPLQQTPPEGWL